MDRIYATAADYQDRTGRTPGADTDRLLREASELLDAEVLLASWYDVDANGMPADEEVAKAFSNAVCAQLEFWAEVGESVDTSGPIQGVTLGSLSIQYGAGDNRVGATTIGPRVFRALALLPVEKWRRGVSTGRC